MTMIKIGSIFEVLFNVSYVEVPVEDEDASYVDGDEDLTDLDDSVAGESDQVSVLVACTEQLSLGAFLDKLEQSKFELLIDVGAIASAEDVDAEVVSIENVSHTNLAVIVSNGADTAEAPTPSIGIRVVSGS